MSIFEDVTVELPTWMRWALIGFAAVFGGLAWWVGRLDGLGADAGAVILGALGLLLLISAARGRIWKWMWFLPGR